MARKTNTLASTLLRSILAYSLAILLCFAGVFSACFYVAHNRDREQALTTVAQNAARSLDDGTVRADVGVLKAQLDGDIRYTLVDGDGDVLFDSSGDTHENHADRPEIRAARELGSGSATRYSSTLGTDTVYAAVLLRSGDVLRLSQEKTSFAGVFGSTAPALAVALLVALLLSMVLSRLLARRAVAPLERVDVARPLDNDAYEEMRPLLERIERQRRQLVDQNSELARAENMRREFSANVSHEMRTPLQVISGYGELLATGNVPGPDATRFAGLILSESRHMAALIDDVLALSRLDDPLLEDAGREEVELGGLVREVVDRTVPLAERRGVALSCLGSAVTVKGNRGLLDQLVSNLVVNGVRYTDEGGQVVVSVGKRLAVPGSDRPAEAYVRVKDTGCGIADDQTDKIFERFYRVDKSRSKEGGGTGLGLAIAKHAAAFHDGTISVESQVGRGSVFTVHLPIDG